MSIARSVSGAAAQWPEPRARTGGVWLAAALFAVAGALFVVYPVLRPYSSESGTAGALAFGSDRWVLAHVSGMVAFGCLAAGGCLLTGRRLARVGTVLGVGLILPYYGAEAFGLHAIGRAAVQNGGSNLTDVVDAVRYNPVAMIMFGAGWIVLAVAGVALARVLWAGGVRTGAVLVGAGMVLYLPQFLGPPWIRIAHGLVLGIGLVIVSVRVMGDAAGD